MQDAKSRKEERATIAGLAAAIGAFVLWGVLSIYWKVFGAITAYEVVAHRIVWTLAVSAVLLTIGRRWKEFARDFTTPSGLGLAFARGALLIGNWLAFIWGVNHDRLLECSLGYYINPLLSVLLGWAVLRERLRPAQLVAIGLAAIGVALLLFKGEGIPWVGLVLACTFASYGLLRKVSRAESVPGLAGEMVFASVPAAAFLVWLECGTGGAFVRAGAQVTVLLACTGVVTALPLLLFAYGARRISLTAVGFAQYLAPSIMFALGALPYGESVAGIIPTFVLIWIALAVFSWDGVAAKRRRSQSDRIERDKDAKAEADAGAGTPLHDTSPSAKS